MDPNSKAAPIPKLRDDQATVQEDVPNRCRKQGREHFTRFVIVLGLLRQALGTQGLPPTQVVIGLAMFMTAIVMAPETVTWNGSDTSSRAL